MRSVSRTALVPFSSQQMFDVVNDVAAYAEFLPWCVESHVLSDEDDIMVAELTIARGGLKHSFTTRNLCKPPSSIAMELVKGPFSALAGHWEFEQLGNDGCRISMQLNFNFDSKLMGLTLAGVFNLAVDSMVDAFCDRAEYLYG